MHHCQKTSVRAINLAAGIALALLLAGCLPPRLAAKADPAVQAARRACASLPEAERYPCVEQQAVRALEPEICRLAGMAIDDACLQAVYEAAADPSICERLYLRGVRPNCRDHYAAGEISAETAGLRWRECPVQPDVEEWRQAEACFGHPALGLGRRRPGGRRRAHRARLAVDHRRRRLRDARDRDAHPEPEPVHAQRQRPPAEALPGPLHDLLARSRAGEPGRPRSLDVRRRPRGDRRVRRPNLRSAHNIEAAYAPYTIQDNLIFVARRDDQYFVVYDGQRLGPAYDRIGIAYCCEPAATSAHGAAGRYTFWGERDGMRTVVEISAQYADIRRIPLKMLLTCGIFKAPQHG